MPSAGNAVMSSRRKLFVPLPPVQNDLLFILCTLQFCRRGRVVTFSNKSGKPNKSENLKTVGEKVEQGKSRGNGGIPGIYAFGGEKFSEKLLQVVVFFCFLCLMLKICPLKFENLHSISFLRSNHPDDDENHLTTLH